MPYESSPQQRNCRKCPVSADGGAPKDDWYQFLTLRFNIRIARELVRPEMLHRVDPAATTKWLESTQIWPEHLDHLPLDLGPGIMVTLPNQCGRLVIDGNHRAARALRDGQEFLAYLLPEKQTLELLRSSMGKREADFYWKRLKSC
ncbi:MAG TPA: hypothetical protein VHN81_07045 [Edaphobacter sp.]|nr:hypothetical protein [Edaphobacter sp.]